MGFKSFVKSTIQSALTVGTSGGALKGYFVPVTSIAHHSVVGDGSFEDTSGFYTQLPINKNSWSSFWPYQLIMAEALGGGQYNIVPGHTFVLPISPSDLQIRTPFASQVSVTLRGILEESNGVPLREISFSGTTGILPGDARPTATQYKQPSAFGTIFGGTINATSTLIKTAGSLFENNKTQTPSAAAFSKNSGYYHFHALAKFLERYALMKKGIVPPDSPYKGNPRNLRLVFVMWKDNWAWLITPREFTMRRMVAEPHLYFYTFAAVAWKRLVASGISAYKTTFTPVGQRPNGFQRLLNILQTARATAYQARNVIRAVRGDLTGKLLDPLRETTMFIKETVGVGVSLYDLPGNVRKDFQQTVARSWGDLRDSFRSSDSFNNPAITEELDNQYRDSQNTTVSQTILPQTASPLNRFFSEEWADPGFFDNIDTTSLDSPIELVNAVENERERVGQLTKTDFENNRAKIQLLSEEIANSLGVGHATYTRLVGQDAGSANTTYVTPDVEKELTPERLDALFALQKSAMSFDALVASGTIDDPQIVDSIQYVAALANAAGIPFTVPQSKYLIPVPFGFSIESISLLYLGDPDRWSEIATLNGLRSPYIDEDGFRLSLLTNASGNEFTVASGENLYVGQVIKLYSDTVPVFKRRILSVEKLGEANFFITVDGDANLSILRSNEHAELQAFLPGTVNSEQLLFIPSPSPAPSDLKLKPVPGIDDADALIKISGIDLLLTMDGDIAVTDDGDTRLAYGLTNIIQAARLKIATPLRSLLRHPEYGFGVEAGDINADITPEDIFNAIQGSFAGDNRFSGVNSLEIQKKGPVLQINLTTSVVGVEALIPVSVQVPLPK